VVDEADTTKTAEVEAMGEERVAGVKAAVVEGWT
jgi:hypothetical protein